MQQPKHIVDKSGRSEKWLLNDKLHREDGPAWIEYDKNGKVVEERWYLNGIRHRENGPAYIKYKGGAVLQEQWVINGDLHREDGPAWIKYQNGKAVLEGWWLNNKLLSKEDFTSLDMIVRMKAYKLFSPIEIARLRKNAA